MEELGGEAAAGDGVGLDAEAGAALADGLGEADVQGTLHGLGGGGGGDLAGFNEVVIDQEVDTVNLYGLLRCFEPWGELPGVLGGLMAGDVGGDGGGVHGMGLVRLWLCGWLNG